MRRASKETLKNIHPKARALVELKGSVAAAAAAAGYDRSYFRDQLRTDKETPVSEKMLARVNAALKGEPAPERDRAPRAMGETAAPRGESVIVICTSGLWETYIYDIAQTMGGEWVFKKKAGTHYVGVVKMPSRRMDGFKALAAAEKAEVIVP